MQTVQLVTKSTTKSTTNIPAVTMSMSVQKPNPVVAPIDARMKMSVLLSLPVMMISLSLRRK